jgi:hypothetical protein
LELGSNPARFVKIRKAHGDHTETQDQLELEVVDLDRNIEILIHPGLSDGDGPPEMLDRSSFLGPPFDHDCSYARCKTRTAIVHHTADGLSGAFRFDCATPIGRLRGLGTFEHCGW